MPQSIAQREVKRGMAGATNAFEAYSYRLFEASSCVMTETFPSNGCRNQVKGKRYTFVFEGGSGSMRYRIALHQSDEGYSVSVPGLPGCWSQGANEGEAIENIKDAIREYLAVVDEQLRGEEVREIDVAV
jgi:predicted RNase H-like HicB family nuclease